MPKGLSADNAIRSERRRVVCTATVRHRTNRMALAIHHVEYDPAQHRLPPRRYAWMVFGIVFALMVMDYVDRQVVVSMFPHLKSQWHLSDKQLGALVSVVSIAVALATVPLS